MNRGRCYRQVPTVRKRFSVRVALICFLALGLVVSITGLALYFIQSYQNRNGQKETAASHQENLQAEQRQNLSGIAPIAAFQPMTTIVATTTAPFAFGSVEQAKTNVFFQMIGLTRKAFKPIVKRNADAVGWITIDGVVNQPIVYRNNTFYLTHDFDQLKNACGAVFLDVNHPLSAHAQNLLLYGHNMKDESMFGKLIKYTQDNFLHSHYQIALETRFEKFTYLIFAVDRVSINVDSSNFLFFWGYPSFESAGVFCDYIDEVYDKSLYTRYLDVSASDTLLTLATCIGDDRLVLFARRQRESDTEAGIQKALLGLYMR